MILRKYLTESSKSPASIAKRNKQWVGTCLYQDECKLLLISYEQVAKRIANIRLIRFWKFDGGSYGF